MQNLLGASSRRAPLCAHAQSGCRVRVVIPHASVARGRALARRRGVAVRASDDSRLVRPQGAIRWAVSAQSHLYVSQSNRPCCRRGRAPRGLGRVAAREPGGWQERFWASGASNMDLCRPIGFIDVLRLGRRYRRPGRPAPGERSGVN